ncbi:MAG: dCTP deaminase [Candidatus Moraniibacteriota bacterium]|nr:MAG: dCTP deaminase [Candidatus Moranbacteria bacterium]
MFLSDCDIQRGVEDGSIVIKDFEKKRLQPASYDVLLGNVFLITSSHETKAIDPVRGIFPKNSEIQIPDGEEFILHPRTTVLGTLKDYVGSREYLIQISGKSSLARIGLVVHNTAGIINPGHFLHITLELANFNIAPIILRPGMAIAQLTFSMLSTPVSKDYSQTGRFNGNNWKKNFISSTESSKKNSKKKV